MRITDPRLNQSTALRPGEVGPRPPNAAPRDTWRTLWRQARFRDAEFFVETGNRAGGRRVALHQYPKRNVPYAEDMGRAAVRITVQGYCIGPFYHEAKNKLITALEKDGPGLLRLPMEYVQKDLNVMVQGYSVTEARERGGMCTVEMEFVEFGDPAYRQNISTPDAIELVASATEKAVVGTPTKTTADEVKPFAAVHAGAVRDAAL
jgi:prophage DNA circulation protein